MGGTADGFRGWDFPLVFFRQRFRLLAAPKRWLKEGGKHWPFGPFGWFPASFSLVLISSVQEEKAKSRRSGPVLRSSGRTWTVRCRCPLENKARHPCDSAGAYALRGILSLKGWENTGKRREQSACTPPEQMSSVCAFRSGWQGTLWLETQEYLSLMARWLPYLKQLISSSLACWVSKIQSLLLVKTVTLYESSSFIPSAMARSFLAEFGSRDRGSVSQFYYLLQSPCLLSK